MIRVVPQQENWPKYNGRVHETSKPSLFSVSDALNLYLKLKGGGRRKTFFQLANRSVEYLKEVSSTTVVESFQTNLFQDWIKKRSH